MIKLGGTKMQFQNVRGDKSPVPSESCTPGAGQIQIVIRIILINNGNVCSLLYSRLHGTKYIVILMQHWVIMCMNIHLSTYRELLFLPSQHVPVTVKRYGIFLLIQENNTLD